MFKASDGQNRQVKEDGLGMDVVLHLEELFFMTSVMNTGEQVVFFKANVT